MEENMNKLELPFDLYTRNFLITKLVKAIKDKDKLKILDVGGRGGQLKDFLKEDEYYILDILNSEEKEENYIVGDIRDAPLRNSSFDIVISSDLYEHIPPRDRLRVISEMLRLSKNFVVLGAPFYSKEVEEAERRVYDFFLKVTGKPHPWLKEHIENGLPSKDELEAFLTKKGYEFCCRETNNISNWFLLQSFIFYAYAYGIPSEKVNKVYRYYNENFVELGDFLKPTYRKIYLIGEKGKLPSLRHKLKINKSINLLKYQNLFSLIFDCIGEDTIRKDTHIRNLESTLSSIKDSIVRKDNQIKNLNRIVNDLNNHIQLKDTHIRNLESTLSSIKDSIVRKDNQIKNLNRIVNDLNNHIQLKDTHIRNLESTLSSIKDSIVRKDNQIKNLNRIVNDLNNHIQLKDTHIRNLESTLSSIKSSIAWRLLTRYRRLKEKILPLGTRRRHVYDLGLFSLRIIINEGWRSFWLKFKRALSKKVLFFKVKEPYKIWILKNEPKKEKLEEYKKESFSFKYRPKISIIIPVWNTDKKWLRKCMESVLNQVYDNWELCIADGGSTKPYVKGILKRYAKKDSRIKVKFLKENKGIAGNSNEALSLATGEFIGFLDHDDELAPFALYEVVKLLNEKPHLDFIYSDEDKIDEKGKRKDPFFKPDWSPDMFLSQNYLCHLSIIRKELVGKVGGFREGYDGSQDYDLFLRVTELIDEKKIAHIPKILYHWRSVLGSAAKMVSAKPYAFMAAKKALKDALSRREIEAEILDGLLLSSYRVRYKIVEDPKVSIIIPTKDKVSTLKTCIDSILKKTNYKNYEIFIIDNQSKEEKTLKYYHRIKNNSKIKIVKYNKPFNFSEINNFAVSKVDTEYILFLNNDTEVISEEWLEAMLEHAQRKQVGAVGAKLLYPDNTIQHAGVILGITGTPGQKGVAGHSHKYVSDTEYGYFLRPHLTQDLSAVTAACMMMRKQVFKEVGGFNVNLAVAFNDVDLCLKIREKGYLIVYTPYAKLYHHESLSRGYEDTPEKQARFLKEIEYVRKKWGHVIDKGDPYYNPNLTLEKEDFSIKIY